MSSSGNPIPQTPVVNTALPSIGRDLYPSGSDMHWVVTADLTTAGGALLISVAYVAVSRRRSASK